MDCLEGLMLLDDGTYVCKPCEFLSRPLQWAIASSSGAEIQELVEARTLIEAVHLKPSSELDRALVTRGEGVAPGQQWQDLPVTTESGTLKFSVLNSTKR